MRKKVAHFLLIPELLHSPPNDAIIRAYIENEYHVDIYSPGVLPRLTHYGDSVSLSKVEYTWTWIIRNICHTKWFTYSFVSGTSEDPLGIVGLINKIYRRRSICLVDEIKSGTYRGDRSDFWKEMCKMGIRGANLNIVNDESRISLLRNYVSLSNDKKIFVYPGCFLQRPEKNKSKREQYRERWGFKENDFIIGSSGGFNLTAGADWLLQHIRENKEVSGVIQPLGVSELAMYLLKNLEYESRLHIEDRRLDWYEAWESAQGLDAGICIYMNQAPQFQNMGISSNRLCMFIAMGVPVIASKQQSFKFIEQYDCGVLIKDYEDFKDSITYIRNNLEKMRENCEKCFHNYIMPDVRYRDLSGWIGKQTQSNDARVER
jgi:glycosyltransferase involved in cell wall biosynthesis